MHEGSCQQILGIQNPFTDLLSLCIAQLLSVLFTEQWIVKACLPMMRKVATMPLEHCCLGMWTSCLRCHGSVELALKQMYAVSL